MKFLVDECLSTQVATILATYGHDAIHVVDLGLAGLPDEQVMARAVADQRILLSADTDFGEILARTGEAVPSVVLFRRSDRTAKSLASVLATNLGEIEVDLEAGSFIVITEERLRIRRLPMGKRG